MLTDALAELVREAGGEHLLLDARNGKGIISDAAAVPVICRKLANSGFTRMINLTAMHVSPGSASVPGSDSGSRESYSRTAASGEQGSPLPDPAGTEARPTAIDEFALFLTLRHPGYNNAPLTLKWKWIPNAFMGSRESHSRTTETGEQGSPLPDQIGNNGGLPQPSFNNGSATQDNETGGAGQSGGQPLRTGPAAHPTLSKIWGAAGVAEREIFELVGIPFDGNDNLNPLYLDEAFNGHPLRLDFVDEYQALPGYGEQLLKTRHEQGMVDAAVKTGGDPA